MRLILERPLGSEVKSFKSRARSWKLSLIVLSWKAAWVCRTLDVCSPGLCAGRKPAAGCCAVRCSGKEAGWGVLVFCGAVQGLEETAL